MSSGYCPECKADTTLVDDGEGEKSCPNCGTVVSECRTVNGPEFTETESGGFQVVGTRVDKFGGTFSKDTTGHARASREVTISRGKRLIEDVVANMRMPSSVVKAATRLYALAVSGNFSKGRRTVNLVAACIYASCRTTKPRPLGYMLIDFSDYFSTNIFVLGHTFLQLMEALKLRLPVVDPSVYIPRFSRELDLGDKQHQVSSCAIRLVARMKRDWILTGRRPSGVCAAGLLISARLHGFNRSFTEISRIVHIGKETIRRRLLEFKATPSCNLTPAEFEAMLDFDDIESADPPAFVRGQEKDKMVIPVLTAEEIERNIKAALGELCSEEINEIAASKYAPKHSRPITAFQPPAKRRKLNATDDVSSGITDNEEEEEEEDAATQQQVFTTLATTTTPHEQGEEEEEEEEGRYEEDYQSSYSESATQAQFGTSQRAVSQSSDTERQEEEEEELYNDDQEYGDMDEVPEEFHLLNADEILDNEDEDLQAPGDIESLSDLDDEEINGFINSPAEVLLCTAMWDDMYGEWEKEKQLNLPNKPRKAPPPKQKTPNKRVTAASPAEAVSAVLQRSMVSSKINQSAIARLLKASSEKARPKNDILKSDPYNLLGGENSAPSTAEV